MKWLHSIVAGAEQPLPWWLAEEQEHARGIEIIIITLLLWLFFSETTTCRGDCFVSAELIIVARAKLPGETVWPQGTRCFGSPGRRREGSGRPE